MERGSKMRNFLTKHCTQVYSHSQRVLLGSELPLRASGYTCKWRLFPCFNPVVLESVLSHDAVPPPAFGHGTQITSH